MEEEEGSVYLKIIISINLSKMEKIGRVVRGRYDYSRGY